MLQSKDWENSSISQKKSKMQKNKKKGPNVYANIQSDTNKPVITMSGMKDGIFKYSNSNLKNTKMKYSFNKSSRGSRGFYKTNRGLSYSSKLRSKSKDPFNKKSVYGMTKAYDESAFNSKTSQTSKTSYDKKLNKNSEMENIVKGSVFDNKKNNLFERKTQR